jgi:hypothetical protein
VVKVLVKSVHHPILHVPGFTLLVLVQVATAFLGVVKQISVTVPITTFIITDGPSHNVLTAGRATKMIL